MNRNDVSVPFLGTETARWGREHLVDLERSEQIYLVIRDHVRMFYNHSRPYKQKILEYYTLRFLS